MPLNLPKSELIMTLQNSQNEGQIDDILATSRIGWKTFTDNAYTPLQILI